MEATSPAAGDGVHVDGAGCELDLHVARAIQPRVALVEIRPPAQPILPAFFGEEVFLLESHLERESFGAFADQHDVVRVVHDRFCHQ